MTLLTPRVAHHSSPRANRPLGRGCSPCAPKLELLNALHRYHWVACVWALAAYVGNHGSFAGSGCAEGRRVVSGMWRATPIAREVLPRVQVRLRVACPSLSRDG